MNNDDKVYVIKNIKGGYFKQNRNGRWSVEMKLNNATLFSESKARNIIANCIPKEQASDWAIIYSRYAKNTTLADKEEMIKEAAESNMEYDKLKEQVPERFRDGYEFNWVEYMNEFNNILDDIKVYNKALIGLENYVHREYIDIRHKIELGKTMNASEGYNMYKRLREVLMERRKIKNDLMRTQAIVEKLDKIPQDLIAKLYEVDTQHYTPRVLKDLFTEEECNGGMQK